MKVKNVSATSYAEDMDSLLSIGAFAQAAGLSSSALRFYDAEGLLPPAHVDPVSGYRFYDAAQHESARLLACLREAGVAVSDMRRVLAVQGAGRATLLDELAQRRLAEAQAAVQILVQEAEKACSGAAATAVVSARYLWEALVSVQTFCGEGVFSHVLIVAGATGIRMLASDRYRLADLHVPADVQGAATLVVTSADAVQIAMRLEQIQGTVELTMMAGALMVAGERMALATVEPLPDLLHVSEAAQADLAESCVLAQREVVGEIVAIDLGGPVLVNAHYLASAFTALGAASLTLVLSGLGPVLCQAGGASRILIMPLRPEKAGG